MLAAFADALRQASPGAFGLGLLLATLACAFVSRYAYRALACKRLIEDTPTSRLRSVTQGFVELTGTARVFDGDPIVAPLSMRHCCWYRYSVQERDRGSRANAEWLTVESETSSAVFMLDDGDGICGIDPEGAQVTPSTRRVWYGNERMPWREPPHESFLGWMVGGRYRYSEERIDLGVELIAIGHLATHGGAAPALEDLDVAGILRDWKTDRAALLARYDRDGNGELSPEEWEQARRDARALAAEQAATAAVAPGIDLVSRPASGERPFILAAVSEETLRRRELLRAWIAGSLSFALTLGIVWALGLRLN
jgi:hypothetical protein